jgi:hypothetical protein
MSEVECRATIWAKNSYPHPIRLKKRYLSKPLSRGAYKSALENGVIASEERFSRHNFKRKGVTDTPKNRSAKQDALGHHTDRMLDVYENPFRLLSLHRIKKSVYFTETRKPHLLFNVTPCYKWCARRDSNSRPPGS